MIVYIAPVSGHLARQQQQKGRQQRKSREEWDRLNPACSDTLCKTIQIYLAGKFMRNHTRTFDYKSSNDSFTSIIRKEKA